MDKISIRVYTNLNHKEETNEFLAIKDNNIIKYNDLENNKMIINLKDNTLERDNNDYNFLFDFESNKIKISLKKLNRVFIKEIATMLIENSNNCFSVKYCLVDENIINEYFIKF